MLTTLKLTIAVGLAAIASIGSGAEAAGGNAVQVGVISPNALYWPVYVADKKAFLRDEKVPSNLLYVGNVAQQIQQLIGGSLDIIYTGCELTIRAIDKGANDIAIIGVSSDRYLYSMVAAPNIKTASDLKGKKVVLPIKKSLATSYWEKWVREQGVKPEDIDEVFDGATPSRYAALTTGAVSAAFVTQPFDFRAKADGYHEVLNFATYMHEFANVCAVGRVSWLRENADTTGAYLRAIGRAVDWLYDPANRQEGIGILNEVSKQDTGTVGQTYDYYFQDAHPFSKGMAINRK